MATDRNTTSRITVYRLKEQAQLGGASVQGYDKVAQGKDSLTGYDYTLWFGDYPECEPSWFCPFQGIASKTPMVRQGGFVLLINSGDATYACTGGLGYHKLLEAFAIEPRFGITVAKKAIAVAELKGLAQKDATGIVNSLDRVFRGTYNPQGDIDNLHRVLRGLRASFDKESTKYAAIGASVRAGDSLVVNGSKDFAGIFALISNVEEIWNTENEGLVIPELDYINPRHESDLVNRLNQRLAVEIRGPRRSDDRRRPNLFLDNPAMGFLPDRVVEYTLCHNRDRTRYSSHEEVFDALASILADFPDDDDRIYLVLESIKIRLRFDTDYVNKPKPLLQYVCGDIVLDNEAYFIDNGRWFRANPGFIAKVNSELDQVPYTPPSELSLQPWRNSEDESVYNRKHAGNCTVVLDRHLVRITPQDGPIEFCDLLQRDDDNKRSLIHVKHASGAALRALFAQGFVSAQLYSESEEFREKVHSSTLDGHAAFTNDDKQALAALAGLTKTQFTVVYAIFDDEASHTVSVQDPTKISEVLSGTLTLFARIDLLGRVRGIRSLGYNVALTRIRPYPSSSGD